jgi:hypothetical protein
MKEVGSRVHRELLFSGWKWRKPSHPHTKILDKIMKELHLHDGIDERIEFIFMDYPSKTKW